MLIQKPPHVKSLPTRPINAENGFRHMKPRPGFLNMFRRFTFVVLTVTLVLAAAPVSAQTVDIDMIRRKAEAGDAKAQFDLAAAYSEGNGVSKDSAKGMEWLKKSALQGFAGAQVVLGYMYQKGINTEKDPSEAAKWYQKAAKQADKDPKHSQTAQTHLSEMLAQGLISAKEADWHASEATAPKQTQIRKPPFSLGLSP